MRSVVFFAFIAFAVSSCGNNNPDTSGMNSDTSSLTRTAPSDTANSSMQAMPDTSRMRINSGSGSITDTSMHAGKITSPDRGGGTGAGTGTTRSGTGTGSSSSGTGTGASRDSIR